MSKSYFKKKEEKEVHKIVGEAQRDLFVERFIVTLIGCEADERDDEKRSTFATCDIYLNNLEAAIRFYPVAVQYFREDRDCFIRKVYHEVAHILTQAQNECLLKHLSLQQRALWAQTNEQLTETIARIAIERRILRKSHDKS